MEHIWEKHIQFVTKQLLWIVQNFDTNVLTEDRGTPNSKQSLVKNTWNINICPINNNKLYGKMDYGRQVTI